MTSNELLPGIGIRECTTVDELSGCVELQRSVFALPEVEISPVRHFVVTMHAGGFTLGAFQDDRLVGFVLSVPAFFKGERALYSHMAAVDGEFQGNGIGAALKWSQRERALEDGIGFIKWTFQPVFARNAFFNLEKLGARVRRYIPDFYGTDYGSSPDEPAAPGLESDRLIAEWILSEEKPTVLSEGGVFRESRTPARKVVTTNDWPRMVSEAPRRARAFQTRVRDEFLSAIDEGLVCEGFERDPDSPAFLFYERQ